MACEEVSVSLSPGQAEALRDVVQEELEERIEEIRQSAIEKFRAGRLATDVEAQAQFRHDVLALVLTEMVGVFRTLVDVVGVIAPAEEQEVDDEELPG